jgi:hypothetical protein
LKTDSHDDQIPGRKTVPDWLMLIEQLDEEDKQTIFRLIEKMLTNKKFKDFFQKNVAAL